MTDSGSGGSPKLRPAYEDIQAHYDISNEFFGLFQDRRGPTAVRSTSAMT